MAEEIRYVEEKLPSANVAALIGAVNDMNTQVQQLDYEVNAVNIKVGAVTTTFENFLQEFRQYVSQDLKDRRYQEALSDQVTIQQQLDAQFSQHARVRRYVLGILQAADTRLVRKETMEVATSELMIAIPHYWLVPALVALAAWINDNEDLARKALREAISRDDEKTCLLFALICRRASRSQAALVWLRRYFAMQDPTDIERKMIVVLDAYANGMFGGDARNMCAEQIGGWIAEMEDIVGFRETQIERWETAIRSKTPDEISGSYPYLEKYATNWPNIRETLRNCGLHEALREYIQGILEKPNEGNGDLKKQLDELLDSLIANYDNAELPLRKQKRIADLVIACKGDEAEAMRLFDAEKSSFDEKTDLMQLLTNAAMNPEAVHASPATQKLSLAIGKEWLIQAYDNITLSNRAGMVQYISIKIEDFETDTLDGENEEQMKREAADHFNKEREQKLTEIKQSMMDYFFVGAGAAILLLSFFTGIPWFIGIACAVLGGTLFYTGKKKTENSIEALNQQYDRIINDAQLILQAICAEVVDFRRHVERDDSKYDETMDYLSRIETQQFIQTTGRRLHSA